MYQNVLSKQWNDLVEDFITENRNSPSRTTGQLRDWYRARAYHFSSVTAIEGITLDQVNKPDFARVLRAKLNDFDFQKPEAVTLPNPWTSVAIGAATGTTLVFLLPLLPFLWAKWWIVRILAGILGFATIVFCQINRVFAAQRKRDELAFMEYARQLEDYLPALLAVCNQYGIS